MQQQRPLCGLDRAAVLEEWYATKPAISDNGTSTRDAVVLTGALYFADSIGRYLQALYLSWSPYHYSAQAYGLAVMYMYRSGLNPTLPQKRALFWVTLLPFFQVLAFSADKHFISWLFPFTASSGSEALQSSLQSLMQSLPNALGVASLLLPVPVFYIIWRHSRTVPFISVLVVFTNAIWFSVFPLIEGFVWTTVFHGIQYLTIVMIFHVRDRLATQGNRRGPLQHALWFYGLSFLLGYAMFNCVPLGYQLVGFGAAESVLLVIAAINIHHFIVDAYIWKLGRDNGNQRIVLSRQAGV